MKEFLQNLVEQLQASEENNRSGLSKQMIKSAMIEAMFDSTKKMNYAEHAIVTEVINSLYDHNQ